MRYIFLLLITLLTGWSTGFAQDGEPKDTTLEGICEQAIVDAESALDKLSEARLSIKKTFGSPSIEKMQERIPTSIKLVRIAKSLADDSADGLEIAEERSDDLDCHSTSEYLWEAASEMESSVDELKEIRYFMQDLSKVNDFSETDQIMQEVGELLDITEEYIENGLIGARAAVLEIGNCGIEPTDDE